MMPDEDLPVRASTQQKDAVATWTQVMGHNWAENSDWLRRQQKPLRARLLLYAFVLTLGALLYWASVAALDEVTRGDGRVVPASQRQLIQSFDGGVVSEINVREGEIVEAGALLMSIDPTRFLASFRENRAEILSLTARAERLDALSSSRPMRFTTTIMQEAPELVAREQRLYDAAQSELDSRRNTALEQLNQRRQELNEAQARIEQLRRSLDITQRELDITRPLLASGAVAEVDVLRLERDVSNAQGEIAQVEARMLRLTASIAEAQSAYNQLDLNAIADWRRELSDVEGRLAGLTETAAGLADRVRFAEIRAPVRGIVQRLYINTLGGVVQPGREVLELVPLDDQLILEVRIAPKDIAFLRPGQAAVIRLTAYDYAVFGGLNGVVDHISADTITDERDNTYYLVRVRTELASNVAGMNIIPGMTAQVDILTGKKTVLDYLLKPVLRAGTLAMRER